MTSIFVQSALHVDAGYHAITSTARAVPVLVAFRSLFNVLAPRMAAVCYNDYADLALLSRAEATWHLTLKVCIASTAFRRLKVKQHGTSERGLNADANEGHHDCVDFALSKLHQVREIDIDREIGEQGAALIGPHLARFAPTLQKFLSRGVPGGKFDDAISTTLAPFVATLRNLEELELSHTMNESMAQAIADGPGRRLSVLACEFPADRKALACCEKIFSACTSLVTVSINSHEFNSHVVRCSPLPLMERLNQLTTLRVSNSMHFFYQDSSNLTPLPLDVMQSAFDGMPSLRHLSVAGSRYGQYPPFPDDAATAISTTVGPQLHSLLLRFPSISASSFLLLCCNPQAFPHLKSLHIIDGLNAVSKFRDVLAELNAAATATTTTLMQLEELTLECNLPPQIVTLILRCTDKRTLQKFTWFSSSLSAVAEETNAIAAAAAESQGLLISTDWIGELVACDNLTELTLEDGWWLGMRNCERVAHYAKWRLTKFSVVCTLQEEHVSEFAPSSEEIVRELSALFSGAVAGSCRTLEIVYFACLERHLPVSVLGATERKDAPIVFDPAAFASALSRCTRLMRLHLNVAKFEPDSKPIVAALLEAVHAGSRETLKHVFAMKIDGDSASTLLESCTHLRSFGAVAVERAAFRKFKETYKTVMLC